MTAETVDTRTGEILPATTADLEPLSQREREVAITTYLSDARDRLALALEATGPQAVAQLKAEIATAAEATKQLGLSKEIQLDAQEMVRRAEYALGKAIRAGQERGEIKRQREGGGWPTSRSTEVDQKSTPPDFFANHGEQSDVYALVDSDESLFEQALTEAKSEGNLSRANVVRKVKREAPKPAGRPEILRKTRHIDPVRIVRETVYSLDGIRLGLELIDDSVFEALDRRDVIAWASSLNESVRSINRLHRRLKEQAQA